MTILHDLIKVFQSQIKSLEILYLLEDVKPTARIMLKKDEEKEKDKIFTFFKKNNLYYAISDFQIIKQDKEKFYSDKGIRISIDSAEKGHVFCYISKNKDLAEKTKELEKNNKQRELGIALGYPKCCSEFFENHCKEESQKQNDFTLAVLQKSDGFQFPFYTNIASRHFDICLLSHFPCSFDCSSSIALAKKHLEVIKKYSKESAETIKEMLKGAVIYTPTNGVFMLKHPKLDCNSNKLYYESIMASKNNQLYQSLKNVNHLKIVNKNKIILDNFEIKNIGVMLFLNCEQEN